MPHLLIVYLQVADAHQVLISAPCTTVQMIRTGFVRVGACISDRTGSIRILNIDDLSTMGGAEDPAHDYDLLARLSALKRRETSMRIERSERL